MFLTCECQQPGFWLVQSVSASRFGDTLDTLPSEPRFSG